jgi:hypothetical protein
MNSAVQFIPAKGKFKSGDLVNLSLRNTSMYPVIFPDDRNVKILRFKLNEQRWVEIVQGFFCKSDLAFLGRRVPKTEKGLWEDKVRVK